MKSALDQGASGPFPNFPHYETFNQLELTNPQVMLLANMVSWTIVQNCELFRAALGSNQDEPILGQSLGRVQSSAARYAVAVVACSTIAATLALALAFIRTHPRRAKPRALLTAGSSRSAVSYATFSVQADSAVPEAKHAELRAPAARPDVRRGEGAL